MVIITYNTIRTGKWSLSIKILSLTGLTATTTATTCCTCSEYIIIRTYCTVYYVSSSCTLGYIVKRQSGGNFKNDFLKVLFIFTYLYCIYNRC